MLTRITLDGYRSFSDLSLPLKNITALIGPNSCGKTSILRAVRTVCVALLDQVSQGWGISEEGDGCFSMSRGFAFQAKPPYWETELSRSIDGPACLELKFDEADFIQTCKLVVDQDGIIDLYIKSVRAQEQLEKYQDGEHRRQAMQGLFREHTPLAVLVPAFYGATQREEYRTTAMVDHLLETSEQSRIIRNLVTRLDPPGFARLNQFLKLSVGAELVNYTSGADIDRTEDLQVFFQDQNCRQELACAGTGLVSLIAMFAALWRTRLARAQGRSLVLLLDEPEAHLHPRLQGQIGAQLADLSTEVGSQLIIATHSVEMINRLAQRSGAVLLGMDMQANRATVLSSEKDILNELSNFCDLSPFASLHLLKSRRILFHEGPTDEAILNRCAEIYLQNDSVRLSRFRAWTFTSLTGVDNAGASDLLKRALAPLFPALRAGEIVRVVRVLDRDYRANPQFGPVCVDVPFESLDITWSRHSIESLFLDPQCLAEWLHPALMMQETGEAAPDKQMLIVYIADALDAANTDEKLTRQTELRLTVARLGMSRSDRDIHRAATQAYDEARSHPEIWQSGRERAKFVLGNVRGRLTPSLQNRIRSDMVQVVTRGVGTGQLLTNPQLIPDEIRRLLDHMTQG